MTPVQSSTARKSRWSHLLRLLWQQPIWAVPFALFFGTLYGADLAAYRLSYVYSLVFAYSIGLGLWVHGQFLVPRLVAWTGNQSPGVAFIGSSYVVAALVSSFAGALILHLAVTPGFLGSPRAVLTTSLYTLVFVGLVSGFRFAMVYHDLALERARSVEQARAELAQAELRALRAQIHPHFLFNTLNAIASLIATQPAAAEEVTTRLAELFRYTLRASEREHATFAEELAFLRSYLEIEHVRFGDRLRVREAIESGLEDIQVPVLLLQPVVENAVRYAVSPRAEGGTIRLAARREGGCLAIEIADDGPGIDAGAPPSGNGFGLHAVRQRLRAAGLDDALTIDSGPERGTRVSFRLPLTQSLPATPGGSR